MLRKIAEQHLTIEFPNSAHLDTSLKTLENRDTQFSAMATIIGEHRIIIFNELNSIARQESDIMHELAHVICEHPGNCLSQKLRKYDPQHENEAIWLGATIQIPEAGLFQLVREGRTNQQIADNYGSSLQMATYRRNILGIDIRISRSNKSTTGPVINKA
ncbi:hypothetical protein GCM10007423_39280 [Dyadobacter endophyticus]|uniref:IrrE N-terminal-like domain-containing protein n=2 Tax=Dyadobacter endophyticus TaxID=1749036 RepID=A0ABQ1YXM1_9BACT|nr:hypothetical protein GCM10007423_39280 [Dyadobacter endophyticus]